MDGRIDVDTCNCNDMDACNHIKRNQKVGQRMSHPLCYTIRR